MTRPDQRNRRRNLFSNPKAQLRIMVFFAFLAVAYACVNYYIAMRALKAFGEKTLSLPLSSAAQHDVGALLSEKVSDLHLQLVLFTLLTISILSLGALLLSHRLGGPIFHLREYMRGVAAGNVKPRVICFRKHDFFHDLAEAFNELQKKQGLLPSGDVQDGEKQGKA